MSFRAMKTEEYETTNEVEYRVACACNLKEHDLEIAVEKDVEEP